MPFSSTCCPYPSRRLRTTPGLVWMDFVTAATKWFECRLQTRGHWSHVCLAKLRPFCDWERHLVIVPELCTNYSKAGPDLLPAFCILLAYNILDPDTRTLHICWLSENLSRCFWSYWCSRDGNFWGSYMALNCLPTEVWCPAQTTWMLSPPVVP